MLKVKIKAGKWIRRVGRTVLRSVKGDVVEMTEDEASSYGKHRLVILGKDADVNEPSASVLGRKTVDENFPDTESIGNKLAALLADADAYKTVADFRKAIDEADVFAEPAKGNKDALKGQLRDKLAQVEG